jgi:hypothetical protein
MEWGFNWNVPNLVLLAILLGVIFLLHWSGMRATAKLENRLRSLLKKIVGH